MHIRPNASGDPEWEDYPNIYTYRDRQQILLCLYYIGICSNCGKFLGIIHLPLSVASNTYLQSNVALISVKHDRTQFIVKRCSPLGPNIYMTWERKAAALLSPQHMSLWWLPYWLSLNTREDDWTRARSDTKARRVAISLNDYLHPHDHWTPL